MPTTDRPVEESVVPSLGRRTQLTIDGAIPGMVALDATRQPPDILKTAGEGVTVSSLFFFLRMLHQEHVVCLLLLLLPLVHASPATPEPCELDEDGIRCACDFSGPAPDWSSAFLCTGAVDVEFYGGGRSLEHFLKRVDTEASLGQYADVVGALPWQRLTVRAARVPAPILFGVLRVLGYSGLQELILENLEVTGTALPPLVESSGPDLNTLSLRNVSWATRDTWLAELQQWLKPGLKVLHIAHAHTLNFSCEQVRIFPGLVTLDLSDNPELGERGLSSALCPHKFPALQVLALRNAGMETPSGVCSALATLASMQLQELDLSHNSLRETAGAQRCDWPRKLNSLNLSFTELKQVPKGLPAKLSVLDLSYNRLDRKPRPDELPEVGNLSFKGNPFLDTESHSEAYNSGIATAQTCSSLAVGISGTLAVLRVARLFV
ncbi:monocyte differentiation antigen CD14 [Acomys russatus]|uniref:monocyte differentiation antigen CD14 n=1 Tax=Acomys russatus TaxID=60746 RepID=UPI0021E25F3F|nr:monocyte differentiation antigen CD14 [Acomys russatus]